MLLELELDWNELVVTGMLLDVSLGVDTVTSLLEWTGRELDVNSALLLEWTGRELGVDTIFPVIADIAKIVGSTTGMVLAGIEELNVATGMVLLELKILAVATRMVFPME